MYFFFKSSHLVLDEMNPFYLKTLDVNCLCAGLVRLQFNCGALVPIVMVEQGRLTLLTLTETTSSSGFLVSEEKNQTKHVAA